VEPHTNRLERAEADVLFGHLESLLGRLRLPDAIGNRNLPLFSSTSP
jgi:hypothetical protein